jgi:predicted HTH domain antitoxin
MSEPVGIRLPKDVLKLIEKLSEEEMEDRSTTIRKLVMMGYRDLLKKKASEQYIKGTLTISEAAKQAGLTIWEMEKYLVENGFRSEYSTEDLEKELKSLR